MPNRTDAKSAFGQMPFQPEYGRLANFRGKRMIARIITFVVLAVTVAAPALVAMRQPAAWDF